jgi:effector-binding domain-containing protein
MIIKTTDNMLSEPKIERRSEQPYFAIRKEVHMHDISAVLPPLIPKVMGYLKAKKADQAGPPFFLYLSMNENGDLLTETGFPVKNSDEGEGEIIAGSFPEGNYAIITYTGDYKNMMDAHVALEAWIAESGLTEKRNVTDEETTWGGRTEFYVTDPDDEPDPAKWVTDIVFLLE